MSEEVWRPIPGYEGLYSVSDRGRIKSHERRCTTAQGTRRVCERIKKRHTRVCNKGSVVFTVGLSREGEGSHSYSVMRLVLMAFDRMPADGEVAHPKDGDPTNVQLQNLQWSTPSAISVANGSVPPWRKSA